jgi:FAD dependent oxidoreductase TIGR03364
MGNKSAIVIGAGIVGLATARALAVNGVKVKIIERSDKAVGASIRNFGMIWPIGQPDGALYERSMLSKKIWKQLCSDAGIWFEETGSLHLAYNDDEWRVLAELQHIYKDRGYILKTAAETINTSKAVVTANIKGSLYSKDEMIVDPREAIAKIPCWLQEKYGVEIIWGKAVSCVQYPVVFAGNESFEADEIFICSGADFETLYPEIYSDQQLTKCKLQMMRMAVQPGKWRIGPALCGGLSLIHYNSFKAAPSLKELKNRYEAEYPDYIRWGIHVMVSQNQSGELTIGDSHEYGNTHEPFDKLAINQLILNYLNKMASFMDQTIIETWNGIYPKLTNGETELVLNPEDGVTIINGLGGAGMTLSFGLAEQIIAGQYVHTAELLH